MEKYKYLKIGLTVVENRSKLLSLVSRVLTNMTACGHDVIMFLCLVSNTQQLNRGDVKSLHTVTTQVFCPFTGLSCSRTIYMKKYNFILICSVYTDFFPQFPSYFG